MSIRSWEQMSGELVRAPELVGLDDDQVRAIIDVLALTIHADSKVSPVEVAGFNHLFFDLSWLEGRHEMVRAHVPRAAERAAVEGDEERGLEVARRSAEVLSEVPLRERVFLMAASLAAVDMKVNTEEHSALRWIAEAFEIDEESRRAILERVSD